MPLLFVRVQNLPMYCYFYICFQGTSPSFYFLTNIFVLNSPTSRLGSLVLTDEFINNKCDVLIVSRNELPRISEKISTKIFKKIVNDIYSNFRVYSKDCLKDFNPKLGETFGLEFLLFLNKKRCKICQIIYTPPPRRNNPRIGGKIKANLRAFYSTFKSLMGYLIYYS